MTRRGEHSGGEAMIDSFRLTLDGENHVVPISEGETLLQATLRAGIDAPRSCTQGHCGSCMSWLRDGEVTMVSAQALSRRDREMDYVLACQARPASAKPIWLDFDF